MRKCNPNSKNIVSEESLLFPRRHNMSLEKQIEAMQTLVARKIANSIQGEKYIHILSGVVGTFVKSYRVTGDGWYMQINTERGIFYAPECEFIKGE